MAKTEQILFLIGSLASCLFMLFGSHLSFNKDCSYRITSVNMFSKKRLQLLVYVYLEILPNKQYNP